MNFETCDLCGKLFQYVMLETNVWHRRDGDFNIYCLDCYQAELDAAVTKGLREEKRYGQETEKRGAGRDHHGRTARERVVKERSPHGN